MSIHSMILNNTLRWNLSWHQDDGYSGIDLVFNTWEAMIEWLENKYEEHTDIQSNVTSE